MVTQKFINCLLPSETKEDIRTLISIRVCVYRLLQLLGVELAPDVANQMMEDPYQGIIFFVKIQKLRNSSHVVLVTFFKSDIASIQPKVKHMNYVHNANAKIALLNSRDRQRSFAEKRRLLLVAAAEYRR